MRYNPIVIGAIGAIVAGIVMVYSLGSHIQTNPPVSTPTQVVDVIIPKGASNPDCGKCYAPHVIKIVLGVNNTVRWTNLDNVPSSVVSEKGFFDSGSIKPNQTWSFVFQKVGIYQYHSEPHPWMKGEVIVEKKEYT